jgi:hypothetical protein
MRWIVLALMLAADPALADPGFDPTTRTWLGADLEVLPSGSLHQTAGIGQASDASAQTAYALGGVLERRIGSVLAFAFTPRVLWNIGPADAVSGASGQSAPTGTQIDLRARGSIGTMLTPATRLFAYVAPGYAIGFQPNGTDSLHPHGAIAGGGVGLQYALGPNFALVIDLGYQAGYQSYTDATRGEIEDRTSYFHLAVGLWGGYGTSVVPTEPGSRTARTISPAASLPRM